jgi:tetratricopeptide (TPR) repeat protein
MGSDRLDKMKELVERTPEDARARYFLAHELFKAEDWTGAAQHFEAYLALGPDDEGAGHKDYGRCLEKLGRPDAAAAAYRRGIDAARAHHHDGLAGEIQFLLEQIEEAGA